MTRETVKTRQKVYFSESDIDYDDLTEICSQKTLQEDYSLSAVSYTHLTLPTILLV